MAQQAKITISQAGAAPFPCSLPPGEYAIGRGEKCRIRLRDQEVSEAHAVLHIAPGASCIEDLASSNGTWVDGQKASGKTLLAEGSDIAIGPYMIHVESLPPAPTTQPPVSATPPLSHSSTPPLSHSSTPPLPNSSTPPPPTPPPSTNSAADEARRAIKNQIHRELIQRLDLKRLSASRASSAELDKRAKETLGAIIMEVRDKLPKDIDPRLLAAEIYTEALRLGPLEAFLADDSITEIMVNGPNQVYVERKGKLVLTGQTFMDDASVLAIIERIVSPIGRRIDESQPYVDARLADGSRVNAIIPPLSLIGPCITIRKFSKTPLTEDDFVRFGTWTRDMAEFLRVCVRMRKNIIVAGGTGSGKTTLLNVLSSFIPDSDRVVTIEDAAELRLTQPHVVRLEARPPNIEGRGAVTIRDLVRNALRMRPDRIIVGECRSGEALDMLQAMNTGHDGSLTTVHANSPRDVVSRLETMVLMSGLDLPSRAIREQISSAVDLIVHESRLSDGSRRITNITEVLGLEGTQTVMQDIFEFRQTGVDADGRIIGRLTPTGSVPTFFEQIKSRGLTLDPAIFQPDAVR
ncbi:MAG: Flp pilus assembly complex ATPase component TadA [Kiritimatiellae bacterium]|nr:Flp pilus assembly complex ATPase component TadA [Kiritimatiellia bacterium]